MVFPLTYFGPIPYYQLLLKCGDDVEFDTNERFVKQTWRNRAQILGSNGPLNLSVPIVKPFGRETKFKDVLISDVSDWRKDHWKSIESAYAHAPFFFYYGDQIKELIYIKSEKLMNFNTEIMKQVLEWLDFSDFQPKILDKSPEFNPQDARSIFSNKELKYPQKPYIQVFSDKFPFFENLSIIDLLMNEGPLARKYINNSI